MINNTPDSKLDETVKNTLSGYEAPYDAADWSRMESMLDAAPKSNTLKWSHAITVIVGIAVVAGGYALYNSFSGTKIKTPEVNTAPLPEHKENPKPVPAPVTSVPKVVVPEPKPAAVAPETTIHSTDIVSRASEKALPKEEKVTAKEEKIAAKDEKNKNKKQKNASAAPIMESHEKIIVMGNEAVFGDMLDSSRGIVSETKEKEEIRKAAKAKKTTPEWNRFTPHMNIDSMRKVREQQRDSVKVQ